MLQSYLNLLSSLLVTPSNLDRLSSHAATSTFDTNPAINVNINIYRGLTEL